MESGRLIEIYNRISDGRRTKVVRRRGFGQYALAEFPAQSIGVFVQRGDSSGEGGSNVNYLANKKRDHEPLSNLFSKLSCKLSDPALVISDGSNANRKFLREFHRRPVSGAEAFGHFRKLQFSFGTLDFSCQSHLSFCHPTIMSEEPSCQSTSDHYV
jgi:hypothetical protein